MKKYARFRTQNLPVILAVIVPIIAAIFLIPVIAGFYFAPTSDSLDGSKALSQNADSLHMQEDDSSLLASASEYSQSAKNTTSVHDESKEASVDLKTSTSPQSSTGKMVTTSGSLSTANGGMEEFIITDIEPAKSKNIMKRSSDVFKDGIPALQTALSKSKRYTTTILLDDETKSSAYILAINQNYASNLNGFFYYLIDETASTNLISPAMLCISTLFDDTARDRCTADGTFAQTDILQTLQESLKAVLGNYYRDEIYTFIYNSYKETFTKQLRENKKTTQEFKLVLPDIEVLYRESFMTYVEFYIIK